MFLTLNIENFNEKNILLNDPVKNILRSGCEFIKIIYSDKNIILNGSVTQPTAIKIKKVNAAYNSAMNKFRNPINIPNISGNLNKIRLILPGLVTALKNFVKYL